ncbi:Methyltransferase domain-containing protein [Lutibacter oricola]|uniref:Methyltransferase domain-containing protein n=1 Tax=Lutibacter oricola TaxID=762486 RepID=A0A1H2VWS6_9FLAO|nr:class I SAM-dependent methyltransferase [Lutibacter oricola]SDW72687.1 Methyltransferase domain-containing protein [Lutibacter oricola]
MWFRIKSFLLFLIKSTNQHGVHSPFVYKLITKCFYKKTDATKFNKFLNVKKWLLNNNKTITVIDFGKGSKVFNSNTRKVKDIAKVAGISTKKAKLLIRLIDYFAPNTLLEIGTSVGLGTSAIAIASNNLIITTLEGCPSTNTIAKNVFKQFSFNGIKQVEGNFSNTLNNEVSNQHFDIVYFDGNHQKKPTLDYFNTCLKNITNDSIFIFDDINWSKEMLETWEEIKKHPTVTVTINTYFWGIVFFRKEQKKQHFTIRV